MLSVQTNAWAEPSLTDFNRADWHHNIFSSSNIVFKTNSMCSFEKLLQIINP